MRKCSAATRMVNEGQRSHSLMGCERAKRASRPAKSGGAYPRGAQLPEEARERSDRAVSSLSIHLRHGGSDGKPSPPAALRG